ncbi:hypothetical protein [Mycobacteroides abscessus]|uniref:hypothetical protein n=1 Tax=Mycobacteroides abscessus TaxID=36809 RepID=UPI000C267AB3|nr:hypothetical protein [Mycobacteroides abscessus]
MHAAQGNPASVVIDHERGVIEIDGQPVPYYVSEGGPTTEPIDARSGETLVTFQCFVVAKNVQIIGKLRQGGADV